MNGAECLLRTLAANGVEVCFMNPGTSEMRFVAALDGVNEVRGVPCLFEGVCSGAADGYGRMKGKPAATLLHLGPGLANALSNLHNARKARTPIVNIVGEHSTQHLQYDAPLSADIESFARTVSSHVRVVRQPCDMGQAASEAIAAAVAPPGRIASLIIPADVSWTEAGVEGPPVYQPPRQLPSAEAMEGAARLLRCEGTALLLGGRATTSRGLGAAGLLAQQTGIQVFADRNAPRIASGRGVFQPVVVPYFPEAAIAALGRVRNLIIVESQPPVSFFGYPETPSYLLPKECGVFVLAQRTEDGTAALEALAGEYGVPSGPVSQRPAGGAPSGGDGALTVSAMGAAIAAWLPDSAIVCDEMVSASAAVLPHLAAAAPHERLPVTGGSIGQGLPVATGAAFACPDRKVVALEADGSGMYTLQALWTIAREKLDIAIVIFANRRYQILEIELRRTGANVLSEAARHVIDIGRPNLDWVSLSQAMGVPACRAASIAEFEAQFRAAACGRGPRLIEAVLA